MALRGPEMAGGHCGDARQVQRGGGDSTFPSSSRTGSKGSSGRSPDLTALGPQRLPRPPPFRELVVMVKFVESDATGLPLKRKQVAHACIACRKRKKRCVHEYSFAPEDNASFQDSVSPTKSGPYSSASMETPKVSPVDTRLHIAVPPPEGRPTSRFVGDLNPEHLFIEATSPNSNRDTSVRGGIGVWQSQNTQNARPQPTSAPSLPGPSQTMLQVLQHYVHTQCLPCVPPNREWQTLRDLYFEKADPLFPVISFDLTNGPEMSPSAIVIRQVICLAAAINVESTPHLRLKPYGRLLSRSEYTTHLSTAIHATIDSGLIQDRALLIRVRLLYSMYMQPTCPEEADLPTAVFAKAAHQLITLGFHIPMDETNSDVSQIRTLFLCTWALDRLNAAIYGRASIIHERDVGWDFDECIRKQEPPFRLFLMITRLLDEVFSLYRPTQKLHEEPLYIDMPILEQLIVEAGATKVPNPLLATIEVFYHAVAILSCRFPQGGSRSALPSRATNSRRSLSADRITELVQNEFTRELSYMPIIPYAISLSLSVGYRKMRYSQIPMFRQRGRRAFGENTKLLLRLGETFWCAKTMGAMAEQVLQEMDKAAASIAQETGSGENSVREGSDPQPETQLPVFSATPRGVPPTTASMTLDSGDMSVLAMAPEIDVWGHIDPNFNMGAVDAAIQGNLDFGTSANWFDWQQQNWGAFMESISSLEYATILSSCRDVIHMADLSEQALLRSPLFHRGVRQIHRKVEDIRHGHWPDDLLTKGKATAEAPRRDGFVRYFTEELRNQLRGRPTTELPPTKPPKTKE
ncbi:hypothetical protein JX265_013330 [Neoarthrinium moseri]|uniref:Transcription factor domain-containing protein n=1 Tax=Neoarthrinium moseri TaxID=1658444 RepID=A0A9P9W8Q0_9PEZI|nr:hypothetical protein JX266_010445 [Neoarthrinium moseri]KAI1850850.1 hypothetical protein JX265_013330 [Neoarthrinium moseri]